MRQPNAPQLDEISLPFWGLSPQCSAQGGGGMVGAPQVGFVVIGWAEYGRGGPEDGCNSPHYGGVGMVGLVPISVRVVPSMV